MDRIPHPAQSRLRTPQHLHPEHHGPRPHQSPPEHLVAWIRCRLLRRQPTTRASNTTHLRMSVPNDSPTSAGDRDPDPAASPKAAQFRIARNPTRKRPRFAAIGSSP